MTITIPTPALLARTKRAPIPAPPKQRTLLAMKVDVVEAANTGLVRPGLVSEVIDGQHDGIVKAKHLVKGQRVQPWAKDRRTNEWAPRGSVRIVGDVERIDKGASVRITWATPHTTEVKPASYRWFDESLVGQPIQTVVRKPGFVNYQEV